MKILIVNTSDIEGGAARAAYRLHKALLSQGVDSQMLVQSKSSDDYTVITETDKVKKTLNKLRPFFDSIPIRFYKERTKTLFSSSWLPFSNIVDKINEINPDIVHLHWICSGMMRIEDIARIKAPVVWSLHDMWAFTGGCHYDEECRGYEKECGNCKILGSDKEKDLSRKIWHRKERTFAKIPNMTIVGLSRWLAQSAKSSTLFKNTKVVNLPNPIDTNIFKPFSKDKARELWRLPKDKKLVLFGAMGATSDPRKGFEELSEALQKLEDKNAYDGNIKYIFEKYGIFKEHKINWYFVGVNTGEYYNFNQKDIDLINMVWSANTVSIYTLIVAIYMGFDEIYLLGMDHNYMCKSESDWRFYKEAIHQKDEVKRSMNGKSHVQDDFIAGGKIFEHYQILKDNHEIKIYNCSSSSLLDMANSHH